MTQNCAAFATQQQRQQQHQQHQQQHQQQEKSKTTSEPTTNHNCDILLNNFLVKKRRFRVLLNYDHIVWERLGCKHNADVEQKSKKECEMESENLSNKATTNGSKSSSVHVDDMIRITNGNSKTATQQYPNTLDAMPLMTTPAAVATTSINTTAPTDQFLTIYYAARVIKSETDCNRWRMRNIRLYNADAFVVQQWYLALVKMLKRQQRVQRLLVFINPYGGRKQGLQVYERYCKPLFKLAGIDASCIISQRANQIRDILMTHDLRPYDAVCCLGGDGTVAEVINGLIYREIYDNGIDMHNPEIVPRPSLPVGIIPAGSTDAVAYSLHGTSDVMTAALHLVLGQRRGLDICSVRNRNGVLRFCASVMSYGYLGDVAAKSEKYRWMGTKRYEYAGVKTFLLNRGYEAEIRLLLPDDTDAQQPPMESSTALVVEQKSKDSVCYVNCHRCSEAKAAVALEYAHDVVADEKPTTSSNTSLQAQNPVKGWKPTDSVVTKLSSIYKEQRTDGSDDVDSFKCRINDVNCDSYDYDKNYNGKHEIDDAKLHVIDNKIKVNNFTTIEMSKSDERPQKINPVEDKQQQDDTKQLHKPCDIFNGDSDINEHSNKGMTNVPTVETRSTSSFCSNSTSNNNNNNNRTFEVQPDMQWKVVKGTFFMISGANITCACSRSPNGISRYCHLGDGHLDLILVRKTSLVNNVRLLINTMGRDGDIRNLPFVETYRTRKFHFRSLRPSLSEEEYSVRGSCQPITENMASDCDDDNASSWNCDGEVVTDLDIIMSSHCQLIDVFMRGPHPFDKNSINRRNSSICCCG